MIIGTCFYYKDLYKNRDESKNLTVFKIIIKFDLIKKY